MTEVQDVKVKLENYYGPLDLLLHLVKEDELDITKLTLVQVVDQFIKILEQAKELNMDLAGEFVVLSSQLLLLKSRRVVPAMDQAGAEEGVEQEEETISIELIRKLLDYKKFKDLAADLGRRYDDCARRHGRPPIKLEVVQDENAPIEVDLWKLVSTFAKVSQSLMLNTGLNIVYQDIPIEVMMTNILQRVRSAKQVSFRELVGDPRDRLQVLFNFLAILELVKQQSVEAKQDGNDIVVTLRDESSDLRSKPQS
jgi:segregation and condensation protein A